MNQHLTAEDLASYRDRTLAPVDLLRVDDHLTVCEACRDKVAASMDTDALAQTWRDSLSEPPRRTSPVWILAIAASVVACVLVIRTVTKPAVIAQVRDGGSTVTLDAAGHLSGIPKLSGEQEGLIRDTLQNANVRIPGWIASLAGKREVLMGASGGQPSPLIAPVGTAVMEDRPRLRWNPVAGATSYRVVIQNESTRQIFRSLPVTETEWTVTEPLERGQRYVWQILASDATFPVPPDPPARFLVLDNASVQRLTALPASHLTRGVLFAEAGLLDAATEEFVALEKENPGSPIPAACLKVIAGLRNPR